MSSRSRPNDMGKVIGKHGPHRDARCAAWWRDRHSVATSATRWRFCGIAGEFITLARVLKTQGRLGEVAVELHSDVPDRFSEGMKLSALARGRISRRELQVEELLAAQGPSGSEVRRSGFDLRCRNADLDASCRFRAAQRAQLDPGWTYISDLVGCTVFDADREIGKVEDVQFGAGEAPLLIVESREKSVTRFPTPKRI